MLTEHQTSWLLPPPRQRAVPWSGVDVLAVFAAAVLFIPELGRLVLPATGFFRWIYGSDFQYPDQANELTGVRVGLWVQLLVLPFQAAALVFIPRLLSEAQPYQLGLTWHHAGRNLVLGILAALIVTPLILGMNFIVTWAFETWTPIPARDHPLLLLAKQGSRWERPVVAAAAVLAAPVVEELFFRGLLQGWLTRRRWGGGLAMAFAFLLTLSSRGEAFNKAIASRQMTSAAVELLPALFVLLLVPVFIVVQQKARSPAGPALFGVALLFAVSHAAVWPTPVALFPLGLALGWLYQRTGSLVAPITLHALFNLTSCVLLLLVP